MKYLTLIGSFFPPVVRRIILGATTAVALGITAFASAEEGNLPDNGVTFFRIGNGETSGTYYPIGALIATAISNPPGSKPCDEGGACGVPGLLASALASSGSVMNIEAIRDGHLEFGFAQADVVEAAFDGTPDWAGRPPAPKLRAIARLYPEAVHIIARRDAGISSLSDLTGKRVSLGIEGSGTLIDALKVIKAANLRRDQLDEQPVAPNEAVQMMRDGQLDAMFFVGGWPAPLVTELAGKIDIALIPIDIATAVRLKQIDPLYQTEVIPAGRYPGVIEDTETLSVGAIWVTTEDQPELLIYAITRVLWNDNTLRQLGYGHPAARRITRNDAAHGVAIPLHPGAEKYYREAGLLD